LEFRGVYSLNGEYRFNIFTKSANKGIWLKMNQMENNLLVQTYDQASDTVSMLVNGAPKQLKLAKPSNTPMDVIKANPAAPQPAAGGQPKPPQPGQPPQPPPAPPVRRRVIRPQPQK